MFIDPYRWKTGTGYAALEPAMPHIKHLDIPPAATARSKASFEVLRVWIAGSRASTSSIRNPAHREAPLCRGHRSRRPRPPHRPRPAAPRTLKPIPTPSWSACSKASRPKSKIPHRQNPKAKSPSDYWQHDPALCRPSGGPCGALKGRVNARKALKGRVNAEVLRVHPLHKHLGPVRHRAMLASAAARSHAPRLPSPCTVPPTRRALRIAISSSGNSCCNILPKSTPHSMNTGGISFVTFTQSHPRPSLPDTSLAPPRLPACRSACQSGPSPCIARVEPLALLYPPVPRPPKSPLPPPVPGPRPTPPPRAFTVRIARCTSAISSPSTM